ncbi:MAG: hypothetical protein GDA42_04570 [Ekhidna sp.]|nr:hypothetical protein [Ekhidna sp.]MBC6409720.1 hypothetical protein [Ekhidna sp.]
MIISELKAFDLLKSKFKRSDENARAVILALNTADEKITERVDNELLKRKDVFLTKDDKVELVEKIERTRADIIKWMFIFWTGQLATLFGLFKLFLP